MSDLYKNFTLPLDWKSTIPINMFLLSPCKKGYHPKTNSNFHISACCDPNYQKLKKILSPPFLHSMLSISYTASTLIYGIHLSNEVSFSCIVSLLFASNFYAVFPVPWISRVGQPSELFVLTFTFLPSGSFPTFVPFGYAVVLPSVTTSFRFTKSSEISFLKCRFSARLINSSNSYDSVI